jgi:hypothetical protein
MSDIKLLLDECRGVYIPKVFAEDFELGSWHLTEADVEDLRDGPESEWYWEAWDEVMARAYHLDANGNRWFLYQDGSLFAMCPELMTAEERKNFDMEG